MKNRLIKSDVLTPRWLCQADQVVKLAIATLCAALTLGLVVIALQMLEPSYIRLLHRLFY